jgi:ATP-dependent DNA ligase
LEQIKQEGGEGIILARPDAVEDTLYKYKLWDHHVGEVVGFEPGKGKYSDTIGSLVVRDRDGNLVRVGGGEGLDDSLRREMGRNWQAYLGRRVRIVDLGGTGTSLRQPRWGGFALEEDDLDSFNA